MFIKKNRILVYLQSHGAASSRPLLMSAAVIVGTCFGVVAAFGNVSGGIESNVLQQNIVESLSIPQATVVSEDGAPFVREEKIRSGDSVYSLLSRLGVENTHAIDSARTDINAQPLFRQLSPGKTITAYLNREGQLKSLIFPLNENQDQALELTSTEEGLSISQTTLRLETRIAVKSADIRYSLFGATDEAGIPDGVASQLVDIFGGEVDFHSDLRKGDHFSVAYESISHQGKLLRSGRVLAAEFINDGQSYKAVWFQDTNGHGGYYTPDGKSLRKSFLRSPLEFSRVTSGFSMARFHPVLQKWRAHKGVDYGAPIGTPIKATGDAVVDFVGTQNGYGNVVILKHSGPYTTLYGHLSKFAQGIRKGSRIAQGDVIGYVGQSGLASGPHLHYEFRIGGVFKNPLAITLPGSPPLSGVQMVKFRNESAVWLSRIDGLRNINLASAE